MKVRTIRQRAKRRSAGWARIKAACGPFLSFASIDEAIAHLMAERG